MLPVVKTQLEARFQTQLRPLASGVDARTFAGNGLVFKVFAPASSWPDQPTGIYAARLEALNMTKAGLGEWVVDVLELQNFGVFISKRYPGTNFQPERFSPAALEWLCGFFPRLHSIKELGVVSPVRLRERLQQFGGTLSDLPQAQKLVQWLGQHESEVAGTPQTFCHRDPHAGNVLLAQADATPAAILVDWSRASPDDPARDLAILTTGTLELLGHDAALKALQRIVGCYPHPQSLWLRLRFWVPLTYLHDMHWFRTKEPQGFAQAVAEKLPKAIAFYQGFDPKL